MKKIDKDVFAGELLENMKADILPYWMNLMEDPRGGFYGRRDGYDRLDSEAPKGAILNARILWTFSAACLNSPCPEYMETARRAYRYLTRHFLDRDFGGIFWSVNADGSAADTKKQFYAIAFAIYGLSEYYSLTCDREALETAMALFELIERHSRDREKGGYIEATARDWSPLEDMRLSEKDANCSKTMNTHLHILEGYAALARVSGDETVRRAVADMLELFCDRIIRPDGHLGLFFDDDWNLHDDACSYGHDIEASWLMYEAAEVVGDNVLLEKIREITRRVALAATEGLMADGSMAYERHADGTLDAERHWWVQAENVVGLVYLAAFHDMPEKIDDAVRCWDYIKNNLVDNERGEWYWSRLPDGSVNRRDDKAGFWKCPYHNSRACLEASRVLKTLDTL